MSLRDRQIREILDEDVKYYNEALKRQFQQVRLMDESYAPPNKLERQVAFRIEEYFIELNKLMSRLLDMKYNIKYEDSLVEYLAKVGYDESFGARPLKRAIQDKVEDFLSEEVLLGKLIEEKTYVLSVSEEQVKMTDVVVAEEKPKKVSRKKKGVE